MLYRYDVLDRVCAAHGVDSDLADDIREMLDDDRAAFDGSWEALDELVSGLGLAAVIVDGHVYVAGAANIDQPEDDPPGLYFGADALLNIDATLKRGGS